MEGTDHCHRLREAGCQPSPGGREMSTTVLDMATSDQSAVFTGRTRKT